MDGWLLVLTSVLGSGGLAGILTAIWKGAKTAARNEILAEEALKTIAAKDKELSRLWLIIDAFTRPEGEK